MYFVSFFKLGMAPVAEPGRLSALGSTPGEGPESLRSVLPRAGAVLCAAALLPAGYLSPSHFPPFARVLLFRFLFLSLL